METKYEYIPIDWSEIPENDGNVWYVDGHGEDIRVLLCKYDTRRQYYKRIEVKTEPKKHNENCYGDPHCGCICGLETKESEEEKSCGDCADADNVDGCVSRSSFDDCWKPKKHEPITPGKYVLACLNCKLETPSMQACASCIGKYWKEFNEDE